MQQCHVSIRANLVASISNNVNSFLKLCFEFLLQQHQSSNAKVSPKENVVASIQ